MITDGSGNGRAGTAATEAMLLAPAGVLDAVVVATIAANGCDALLARRGIGGGADDIVGGLLPNVDPVGMEANVDDWMAGLAVDWAVGVDNGR